MKQYLPVMATILAALILYLVFIEYQKRQVVAVKPVEFSAKKTGRKILFNPKEITAKPGVKMMAIGGGKQIEGLNAFILEESSGQKIMQAVPAGWEISEEQEYTVNSGAAPVATKCYRSTGPLIEITCPSVPQPNPTPVPTPIPEPGPTPNPNPTPIEPDKNWGRAAVHATAAQQKVNTENVVVGICDTGIDLQHPNNPPIVWQKDFTGKGSVQDGAGHGTHVAGIIGGRGNGTGVSRAKVAVAKCLADNGSGTSAQLGAGMKALCDSSLISHMNNSWGSDFPDSFLNSIVQYCAGRGIGMVFANGNNGSNQLGWPAQLSRTVAGVFGVAASTSSDQKATYSQSGDGTDAIQPGSDIVSNIPGGRMGSMSGTSMAAPNFSGLLAFCKAQGKNFNSCLKSGKTIAGYPMFDAALTVQ